MNVDATISGRAESPMMSPTIPWSPTKVGMLAFLLSEVAFFSALITTYIVFLRETIDNSVPKPAEVFHMPLVFASTGCLLFSSVTIHLADRAFRRGHRAGFLGWWGMTILLGGTFIVCTAKEWLDLINKDGLTISRNMFGSTYFTLVGFHAAHVTIGLLVLSIVWILGCQRKLNSESAAGVEVVSWYWHFVDVVWIFVFTLVYLISADHRQYIVWFGLIVAVLAFFLIRSELQGKPHTALEAR
jgi:cytochrome c oxidase subunit 3/cytochrome o ubiquinol oxidase subunit 3